MRLKFNGIISHDSSGCIPCGAKRKSSHTLVTSKLYILPSGRTQVFYAGREADVADADGDFLLSYMYTDKDGVKRPVFERVD